MIQFYEFILSGKREMDDVAGLFLCVTCSRVSFLLSCSVSHTGFCRLCSEFDCYWTNSHNYTLIDEHVFHSVIFRIFLILSHRCGMCCNVNIHLFSLFFSSARPPLESSVCVRVDFIQRILRFGLTLNFRFRFVAFVKIFQDSMCARRYVII